MSKLDRFSSGRTIDETKDRSSNIKIEDLIDVFKFPNKKWSKIRLIGGITSYSHFWFPIVTKDERKTSIPKMAISWDADQQTLDSTIPDPYRDLAARVEGTRLSPYIFGNAIIRELQDSEPAKKAPMTSSEKETLYKEKDSDSWTPVRVLRLPPGLAMKIKNLGKLNTHPDEDGVKRSRPVSDVKYGTDIAIYYDKDAEPSNQYQVNIRDHAPLTETEIDYLMYKLDNLVQPDSIEEATRQVKQLEVSTGLKSRGKAPSGGDDDDYTSASGGRPTSNDKEFSMDGDDSKSGGDDAALFKPKPTAPPAKQDDNPYSFD